MINIVHFHNGKGGGVWTVIKNLVQLSNNRNINNHIIFTVEEKDRETFHELEISGAASVKTFFYSANWNFYHTCCKLKSLLPVETQLLIAHDWLELGMVSNLGLKFPVIQFLHGDYPYYYELAVTHQHGIDVFLSVAENIKTTLSKLLPGRSGDINYLRFPVPDSDFNLSKEEDMNIVFLGRLSVSKGYNVLPLIASELIKLNVFVKWHIIGADTKQENQVIWPEEASVKFYGELPAVEVKKILNEMNLMVLPSQAEGMPVSVIEGMKAGVIPLVSDIPGGIQELVIHKNTGFKNPLNGIASYISYIKELVDQPELRNEMSKNCMRHANQLFDPKKNTKALEDLFIKTAASVKLKVCEKIYGSRLDRKYLPNFIVTLIRRMS